MSTITIPRLFDAHVHFREGNEIPLHVGLTASQCAYALVMPNLQRPLTTAPQIAQYAELLARGSGNYPFQPLFTAYLTPETTPADVIAANKLTGAKLVAYKIYPAGATTHSSFGIPDAWFHSPPAQFLDTLRAIAGENLVLCVHGELATTVSSYTREAAFVQSGFIERFFDATLGGRLVLEHISTCDAVEKIRTMNRKGLKAAASVTLHHLCHTKDDVAGCVHNFCRPCPQTHFDRSELRCWAAKAPPWIFLGSDSAPHPVESKYREEAAAGCYTSPALAERLVELFVGLYSDLNQAGAALALFVSGNACNFYGLPMPSDVLKLEQEVWTLPPYLHSDGTTTTPRFVPWEARKPITWRLRQGG